MTIRHVEEWKWDQIMIIPRGSLSWKKSRLQKREADTKFSYRGLRPKTISCQERKEKDYAEKPDPETTCEEKEGPD